MTSTFEYFVVFAEMRTGSNFLESNLNALDGVTCHGEAFNPHFIAYPKTQDILGVNQLARDLDPHVLLSAIKCQPGQLGGFRYFHDHDPRILDHVLQDRSCAKIILTRNPAESYVSWKIAQSTGQWKLTDVKRRKSGQARFDADEFDAHVGALQKFQLHLLNELQKSGQTAFYVAYEDLQSLDIMNGLASYLGIDARLEGLDKTLKVQNPSSLSQKVENFEEMEASLAGVDRFNLTRTPNFEPRRAAAVPTYVAAADSALLYMPIHGGPVAQIEDWLARLDGVKLGDLRRRMSQKNLRQWKRSHPGHRSFTVLRHPVKRAHYVFCEKILKTGEDSFPQIRQSLIQGYGLKLPDESPGADWGMQDHNSAFKGFLRFLKENLSGQTAIRVDATWASQSHILQGFGAFILPDHVFREDELEENLKTVAERAGGKDLKYCQSTEDTPYALSIIYDEEVEALAKAAYQRDYMMFGFEPMRL